MKHFAVVAMLFFHALQTHAIVWDFDKGSRQGWIAREGLGSGIRSSQFLGIPSKATEGTWQLTPLPFESRSRRTSIELISPHIGYDSALFDRIKIRVRITHPRSIGGVMWLTWTNPTNRSYPGGDTDPSVDCCKYYAATDVTFSSEWREYEIANIPQDKAQDMLSKWEGELVDIRIDLRVYHPNNFDSQEDIPELVEVDWIELTGVEEQLLAEPLPVPGADLPLPQPGTLFDPPFFNPVIKGLGPEIIFSHSTATLADVEGDGDLDVAAFWEGNADDAFDTSIQGWVLALNDGAGKFTRNLDQVFPATGGSTPIPQMWSGDLDGDGGGELVVGRGGTAEVWHINRELQMEVLFTLEDRWILGVVDGDGDGRGDLVVQDVSVAVPTIEAWTYKDGKVLQLSSFAQETLRIPYGAGDFSGSGQAQVLWGPPGDEGQGGWAITSVDGEPSSTEVIFDAPVSQELLRSVGDWDGDGDLDLVSGGTRSFDTGIVFKGLTLWRNQGEGKMEPQRWYDETVSLRSLIGGWDLNGDGILDPVFVNTNW